MKRGRQKFEKQVYQNFETALAKKLNFVVDKDAKPGGLGSVSRALQLTPLISNYQDIEGKKQFGVMFYTRANYTSVTDPATGWRKTIYIKNGREEEIKKQFLEKFNDFGFDGKDYYFEYTEEHAGHTWRMFSGSNGIPLPRFQNKKQMQQDKNIWVPEQINVADILDKLFVNFDKTKSFKTQIEQGVELQKTDMCNETAWQSLRYALDLIQQIRNSGEKNTKDDNFLYSPVRSEEGKHFDTRNYMNNGELSSIVDADANGAYNIARKGLIMEAHIKQWIEKGVTSEDTKKGNNTTDLDLFVSDQEWDLWLLDRERWKKELPVFASRSAKHGITKSKTQMS
jgi:CRISPR-associated protein Cpf1